MNTFHFHPAVMRWFSQTFAGPTEPQALGWPAIQSGRHVLISAPTGSGKTLSAFLASLDTLFREGAEAPLPDETRVVYVSPLKALSNDIRKNLQEPLEGIRAAFLEMEGRAVDVRAEVRTGDTSAAARRAIIKKPPHIIVTTPESFYLLLTSESGRAMLRMVRTLIVDEIHAIADDRRGSHLALSIERLEALTGTPLQRIGLSATQKPIEEVARFLVGARAVNAANEPDCAIVNVGHKRKMDLALELPGSQLEAVMSNEVWEEVYKRIAALIEAHKTTLVFVNTRRMAERVTRQLGELIGEDAVTSHHGSLSAELRLNAEDRLKRGELKALVATASLELGIDIGSVDLVCQLGSTRSIAAFLQRVGRAEHRLGGLPKGRLFPLTRDELVECVALLRAVQRGDLDRLIIPEKPLDVLAQQVVAMAGNEDLDEEDLFQLVRRAWPYRNLAREEFDKVVCMLAEGFSTKRGRRAALIHHDKINHRIRGRRSARLLALTSGGAIPDNADYRVVLDVSDTFIGTVNEDFAVESMAGDIFQLGNTSWRILGINASTVRVEDAKGQPPGIPFWLGEAPSRTDELSRAVSQLREECERVLLTGSVGAIGSDGSVVNANTEDAGEMPAPQLTHDANTSLADWLCAEMQGMLPRHGAEQLSTYFADGYRSLGVIPSQDTLVLERFFDESGGMQLVLHSPYGNRINRAWGLALRKRFCRSFNFELQAAATEDAIVISLGTQHSFPLEDVFRYLNSNTVREVLVQALLDAPMFTIRWRWNATRSLAIPRRRGNARLPAPLQRMEAENLMAAVFPDQLACLEHIVGDREVPDHPLITQTIDDCLNEAMDIGGLEAVLRRMEAGEIRCIARDLPEPSAFAHEILNAKPYAFLDNAPLEERRTQAVYTRRASETARGDELGALDVAAIEKVQSDAWPDASNADELHDALMMVGVMSEDEIQRTVRARDKSIELDAKKVLDELVAQRRVVTAQLDGTIHVSASERAPMLHAIYGGAFDSGFVPEVGDWNGAREDAVRELVRGRIEVSGPITVAGLSRTLHITEADIEIALIALEGEGFVLRGRFHPDAQDTEWCDRRLLARIHRMTIDRLRAEIQAVSVHEFFRFLFAWQRVDAEHRLNGPNGVEYVIEQLDGCELPLSAWEPEVISARVGDYKSHHLDRLCFSGRAGWGRFTAPQNGTAKMFAPLRSSPIALYLRESLHDWLLLSNGPQTAELPANARRVFDALSKSGAQFFTEIVRGSGLLPVQVEQSLAELSSLGIVTADGFDGLRALLVPSDKRPTFGRNEGRRHAKTNIASVEHAGRWSLLRPAWAEAVPQQEGRIWNAVSPELQAAQERFARTLLRRYGVVFRRLLEREAFNVTWYDLARIYRRWEARGEIRGGYFVSGVSGEQFALPEAIGLLRSLRRQDAHGELITISAADPLNLVGIVTPGARISALTTNRLVFRDGVPVAALEAGQVRMLATPQDGGITQIENALRVGKLAVGMRPYYG